MKNIIAVLTVGLMLSSTANPPHPQPRPHHDNPHRHHVHHPAHHRSHGDPLMCGLVGGFVGSLTGTVIFNAINDRNKEPVEITNNNSRETPVVIAENVQVTIPQTVLVTHNPSNLTWIPGHYQDRIVNGIILKEWVPGHYEVIR